MSGAYTPGMPLLTFLQGTEQVPCDTEYSSGQYPLSAAIPVGLLAAGTAPVANFRNAIDGGDFTVNPWQRGTTFTGITNTVTYTADRFAVVGGASSSISVSQQTLTNGVLPTFLNALQFGRASANTNTAPIYLTQVMESLDCYRFQGQQVTLSFYALAGANFSAALSKLTPVVVVGTGVNQSTASMIAGTWTGQATVTPTSSQVYSIANNTLTTGAGAYAAVTTTWQRYIFTYTIPTTATQIGVYWTYTPVGTAGANDWVQFAGIQFESGAYASTFEHRDAQVELEIAQRYCFAPGGTVGALALGAATSATAAGFFVNFPVQMRTAPSAVTVTTPADLSVYTLANVSVAACSAVAFGSANPTGCHATVTSSGMTTAVPYVLYITTALAGNIVFSADL